MQRYSTFPDPFFTSNLSTIKMTTYLYFNTCDVCYLSAFNGFSNSSTESHALGHKGFPKVPKVSQGLKAVRCFTSSSYFFKDAVQ